MIGNAWLSQIHVINFYAAPHIGSNTPAIKNTGVYSLHFYGKILTLKTQGGNLEIYEFIASFYIAPHIGHSISVMTGTTKCTALSFPATPSGELKVRSGKSLKIFFNSYRFQED